MTQPADPKPPTPTPPTEQRSEPGPRSEAQLYPWNQLTDDQKKAIRHIHDLLHGFVRIPLPEEPQPVDLLRLPQIDRHRPSNILLVEGGRGSGKTTVVLTLLELWSRALRRESIAGGDFAGIETDAPEVVRLLGDPGELQGRLVPLPMLDLQPLPDNVALLPWLAGRLVDVVRALDDSARRATVEGRYRPNWEEEWGHELPSRKAWRELIQAVAAGWNGNLAARSATLDPEAYAVELEQAELSRLDVVTRWRHFVSRVAEDAAKAYRNIARDVRLVISIDDADMNPRRCVELLDLLRMLWHPQVVFVLTGDNNLFFKMLYVHYLRALRGPGQGISLTPDDIDDLSSYEPSPRQLARDVYDKAIPPGQRFSLPPLAGEARLQKVESKLSFALKRYPNEAQLAPPDLAGYFKLHPYTQYSLPERVRGLNNVRQHLDQLRRDGDQAGDVVRRLWRDAVDEEDFSTAEREAVKGIITVDEHAISVHLDRKVEPLHRRSFAISLDHEDELHVTMLVGFRIRVPEHQGERSFSRRLTALLLLAIDLAADDREGAFPIIYPAPSGFEVRLAYRRSPPERYDGLEFCWPTPDWPAPVDFIVLGRGWGQAVAQLQSEYPAKISAEEMPARLAHLFLHAVSSMAQHRAIEIPVPPKSSDRSAWGPLFDGLYEWIHRVRSPSYGSHTLRERAYLHWLRSRVPLLAAPESGLPVQTANELLRAWEELIAKVAQLPEEEHFAKNCVYMAKRARRERVRVGLAQSRVTRDDKGVEKLLARIDKEGAEYHFTSRIEGRPIKQNDARPEEALMDLLRRIPVAQAPMHVPPNDLRGYVEQLGFRSLLAKAAAPVIDRLQERLRTYENQPGSARLALTGVKSVFQEPSIGPFLHPPKLADIAPSQWVELLGRFRLPIELPIAQFDVHTAISILHHDVLVDEEDMTLGHDFDLPTLPLYMTPIATSGGTFRLPAPAWPALLDKQLYVAQIAQLAQSMESIFSSTDPMMVERASDGLLLAAMNTVFRVYARDTNNRVSFSLHTEEQLSRLMRNLDGWVIPQIPTAAPGARWHRMRDWALSQAALVAAPESGLSSTMAGRILELWSRFSDEGKAPLRAARLAALYRDTGEVMSREEALTVAQDNDKSFPDHPWLKLIGPAT